MFVAPLSKTKWLTQTHRDVSAASVLSHWPTGWFWPWLCYFLNHFRFLKTYNFKSEIVVSPALFLPPQIVLVTQNVFNSVQIFKSFSLNQCSVSLVFDRGCIKSFIRGTVSGLLTSHDVLRSLVINCFHQREVRGKHFLQDFWNSWSEFSKRLFLQTDILHLTACLMTIWLNNCTCCSECWPISHFILYSVCFFIPMSLFYTCILFM